MASSIVMISSSPTYAFSTIGLNYSDPRAWTTSAAFVDVRPPNSSGVSKPRKKIYRPKKIYKDGPYPALEPSLTADPNVFQLIAKAIGEWFNGKSKTKNTAKSVEGVTKEAPWKDESLTASKQSRASYSGLSGEEY